MLARLSIVTAFKPGALLIPRESLLPGSSGGTGSVMVVDDANRARRVPVGLGLTGDRSIEILSGLREGQLVVTSGVAELADGDQLAPQVQLAQR